MCGQDQPHIAAAEMTWRMMLMMMLRHSAQEPRPVPGHTWQIKR